MREVLDIEATRTIFNIDEDAGRIYHERFECRLWTHKKSKLRLEFVWMKKFEGDGYLKFGR